MCVFCLIISIVFFISSFFSFITLSRRFLSVIAVISFEMSNFSVVMLLKLHSFSISIYLRNKSSGVLDSVCLVQKKSPRLWYVFLFGRKFSLINRISSLIAILSGSVLYSALVIWYRTSEPMPHTESSCIWFSFVAQYFCVISSNRISSAVWIFYFRFVFCRNRLSHCLGVNVFFPSVVASKFGTSICVASCVIVSLFQLNQFK